MAVAIGAVRRVNKGGGAGRLRASAAGGEYPRSMIQSGEAATRRTGQPIDARRPGPGSPGYASAMTDFEGVLATIDVWGADHAAACVLGPDGVLAGRGDAGHRFRWASVTKLATAWTVLIAADRGLLDLDEPAGPPGATVRHLLAHASGLPFEGEAVIAAPGTRRIYSNPGFDALGALVGERAGAPFELRFANGSLLARDGRHAPGQPSQGLHGPIGDLSRSRRALPPALVAPAAARAATTVAFADLKGRAWGQ